MDLGAILFLLALLILVVIFVGRPFLSGAKIARATTQENSALLAERERILTALQELDFDNALGKIPTEDYPTQRADLLRRGADVLRQLDELQGKSAARTEERLEAAVAARRSDAADLSDDDLEDMIARRRQSRKEKTGGFCPRCGKPVLLSDQFCPACGHALK
jgi:rubrerythrin